MRAALAVCSILVLSQLVAAAEQDILDLFNNVQNSPRGTWYVPGGPTACNYYVPFSSTSLPAPEAASNAYAVAVASSRWDNGMICGLCIKVNASGEGSGNPADKIGPGVVYAFVNDHCPSCGDQNALDFSWNPQKDGQWEISWQAINCPVGDTKIQYVHENSNEYYIKVQPRNMRVPVAKMRLKLNGEWRDMSACEGTDDCSFFDLAPGVKIPYPVEVELTDIAGKKYIDTIPSMAANDVILDGGNGIQFDPIGSSTGPSTNTVTGSGTNTVSGSGTNTVTGSGSSTGGGQDAAYVRRIGAAMIVAAIAIVLL